MSKPRDPLAALADQLDEDTMNQQPTTLSANELAPPDYGAPQRDAIGSVIEGIAADLCGRVNEIRTVLDRIEQKVLQSVAGAKGSLNDTVVICVRLKEEIEHIKNKVNSIDAELPQG